MRIESLLCQVRAIADHIVATDHSSFALLKLAGEFVDTLAVIDAEIRSREAKELESPLRKLLSGTTEPPKGGAA